MTKCIKQIRIGFPALRKGNLQKLCPVGKVDEGKSPSTCYEKRVRPALEDMLLFDLKARVSRKSLVRYESVQALGSLRDCTIALGCGSACVHGLDQEAAISRRYVHGANVNM